MFLIIGDLHFQVKNRNETDILHQETLKIIQEYKVSDVVILGDTLHRHDKIDMSPLCRAIQYFQDIQQSGVNLYILIGNHDRPHHIQYKYDDHPFNSLKLWERTYIVDQPMVFNTFIGKILCIPYYPNGTCMQHLTNIDMSDIKLAFSHVEFDGTYTSRFSSVKCDYWPDNYPTNYGGHIHNAEYVKHNLIYVGTPFQHDFSDSTDKGVFLLDSSLTLSKIKLPIPPKIQLKITVKDLEKLELPTDGENSNIKITIVGCANEAKLLLKNKELAKRLANVKVQFHDTSLISNKINTDIVNNTPFSDRLLQEIQKHNELFKTFKEIFPY